MMPMTPMTTMAASLFYIFIQIFAAAQSAKIICPILDVFTTAHILAIKIILLKASYNLFLIYIFIIRRLLREVPFINFELGYWERSGKY